MESLVEWYQSSLGHMLPKEMFVFLVSMLPLVELKGGLIVARLLEVPLLWANILCLIGNIVPITFMLLFIRRIFAFLKSKHIFRSLILRLEERAKKKSAGVEKGEFWFLLCFVGVPLPGTGAWSGSFIASILEFNVKKAVLAISIGLLIGVVVMDIVSYGVLGAFLG